MDTLVAVAVIYYSANSHLAELAREIAVTVAKAGAEVRLRQVGDCPDVPAATAEDIIWADAVIMGTPTRFGNVSGQLKTFIDTPGPTWHQGLLADKVYSTFTSSGTRHGGFEATHPALTTTFQHFGDIVVAPGYTHPGKFADGNPYGTSHCDDGGTAPVDDIAITAARIQAERVVRVAAALVTGGLATGATHAVAAAS
jgi:NAD(P)H dehydrogenase (quinone)